MMPRVLMVDDEPLVLEALSRQLRGKVSLDTATNGREALELLKAAAPYEIVISDMRMPGMRGDAFLEEVRKAAPDSVRMILSGHAELESVISAVNRGQIFRFLIKPCSAEDLAGAIEAGVQQYRLVTGQRELLERTLKGAVEVLTEILSLTHPLAQRRANRIAHAARKVAAALGITFDWQVDLACMLSQIGCIALHEDLLGRLQAGEALTAEEDGLYRSHPELAARLLSEIPRLEGVVEMIRRQMDDTDTRPFPECPESWEAGAAGVFLLRVATVLDDAEHHGMERRKAVARIATIFPNLAPATQRLLEGIRIERTVSERITVRVSQLRDGMILDEDLVSTKGLLLASKGQHLTRPLIVRLRSIAESAGVREPFRVCTAG